MKLNEVLAEAIKAFFTDEEVTKAYAEAKQTPEYKRIIDAGAKDTTSKVRANRGNFRFTVSESWTHPTTGKTRTWDKHYKIYAHGMIRTGGEDHHTRLRVPPLTDDNLLENYKRMLDRVADLVEKTVDKTKKLKRLPKDTSNNEFVKNGEVKIVNQDIRSLADLNLPKRVKHLTVQSNSYLDDLSGGPEEVSGSVYLYKVWLKNLKGCPKTRDVYLSDMHDLESLEGLPPEVETLRISSCPKLKTLEHLPPTLKSLNIYGLDLDTLEGFGTKFAKKIDKLTVYEFSTKSHALALQLVSNKSTSFRWSRDAKGDSLKTGNIIEKHIHKGKAGLIDCQHDLIEDGLDGQAKV